MTPRPTGETGRQVVHILAGVPALALRWLSGGQAAAAAATAVLFNLIVLPRLLPGILRPGDTGRPWQSGVVLYPAAVLGLVLCFPRRLDIVAIAWAILAAGDGFATLVGRAVRTPALPWNREKTIAGLAAFVLFGTTAGTATGFWMTGVFFGSDWSWFLLVVPALAAGIAAFAETTPIRLNDNVTVPAAAAFVLWSFSFVEEQAARASLGPALDALLPAAALNVVVAGAGWLARTVTLPGALVGAGIGITVYVGTGPAGWALLFVAFLAATLATRLGFRRKVAAGIAEARGGRRGPGNAIANTGLAAWAAALSLGMSDPRLAVLAMVAALVTASSDTIASEAGKAWGRTTWLPTAFRRVTPGTIGAVSVEGTAAGIVSAAALAGCAAWLGLISAGWIVTVVAAATVASFVEGLLGAAFERSGILNNDASNLLNTAMGAGLALAWAGVP